MFTGLRDVLLLVAGILLVPVICRVLLAMVTERIPVIPRGPLGLVERVRPRDGSLLTRAHIFPRKKMPCLVRKQAHVSDPIS